MAINVDEGFAAWILELTEAPDNEVVEFFRSNEEFKTRIQREWKRIEPMPDTLLKITFNSIVKNKSRFLSPIDNFNGNKQKNPFSILTKPLTKRLLAEFMGMDTCPEKLSLVLQLLNNQTTEFECYPDIAKGSRHRFLSSEATMVFRHMLLNCPKMQKVEVTEHVWEDCILLLRVHLDDLFPIMAANWKNLSFLTFTAEVHSPTVEEGFSSAHTSLINAVCVNLPNLSGLEIEFNIHNEDDATQLSKMQHLKYLNLRVCYARDPDEKQVAIITKIAGELPKLERFAFTYKRETIWPCYYSYFVEQYGAKYPEKKLAIESLWIYEGDLNTPWPKALSVQHLHLSKMTTAPNILAMDSPVQWLHLHKVRPKLIHMLVDKFGQTGLSKLDIQLSKLDKGPELDLHKVISSCPSLDHINILMDLTPLQHVASVSKVLPEHFRNCEFFAIQGIWLGEFIETQMYVPIPGTVQLYKLFLLGSEVMLQTLSVSNLSHMKAIEMVLGQKPTRTCLDKLEQVCFYLDLEEEEFVEEAFKTSLRLYKHSPYFKKVIFMKGSVVSKVDFPYWFTKMMEAINVQIIFDKKSETMLFYKEARYRPDPDTDGDESMYLDSYSDVEMEGEDDEESDGEEDSM